MPISTFEEFEDIIFSLRDKFEKMRERISTYSSMRNLIDKNKARVYFKEFFEPVKNDVNNVLEALNNELVDIL